jgi:hypothetical protein
MEIYGQFTCDNGAGSVEWTRASPPYSFLSLTAVDESSIWLGPRKGPLFYLVDQDEARAACRARLRERGGYAGHSVLYATGVLWTVSVTPLTRGTMVRTANRLHFVMFLLSCLVGLGALIVSVLIGLGLF